MTLSAETGYDAWLRYAPLDAKPATPAVIVTLADSVVLQSAREELLRGLRGMTGRTLRIENALPNEDAIVLQTLRASDLKEDGYRLKTVRNHGARYTYITASNDRGVLYGAFALLRKIALGESIADLNEQQSPYAPVRWVNHWDNLDGSIERGYGGQSIFWENGHVRPDLTRVNDYGRMLASLGINGCSINNVNADRRVLTTEYLAGEARIAEVFRR